jgi:hypothetical protein
MRNRTFAFLVTAVSVFPATGCRTPDRALDVPVREEFVAPPDDPRYTQPPEAGYRAPAAKKDWGAKPGPGGGSMMNGGMSP